MKPYCFSHSKQIDYIPTTTRGDGGFGSTNKNNCNLSCNLICNQVNGLCTCTSSNKKDENNYDLNYDLNYYI